MGFAMTTNALDHLQEKWTVCHRENEALREENKKLRDELEELQRRQKIALDNAYADGYKAGQADATKRRGTFAP